MPKLPRFIGGMGKRLANRFKVKSRRNALPKEAQKLKELQATSINKEENVKTGDVERYKAAVVAGKTLSKLTEEFGKKVVETVDYCVIHEVNIVHHLNGGPFKSYGEEMNKAFPSGKIEITPESKTELEGIFQKIINLLTKYDGAKKAVEGVRGKVFSDIVCIEI